MPSTQDELYATVHAADELAIICYSTNNSELRSARMALYLALREHGSRSDVDAFMERMQAEIAGGPVTRPLELLGAAREAILASGKQPCSDRTSSVVCPQHGYRHEYGDCTKPLGEQF